MTPPPPRRTGTRAPDRGASVGTYLAAISLILVVLVVSAVTGSSDGSNDGVCRTLMGFACGDDDPIDENAGAFSDGELPGLEVDGEAPPADPPVAESPDSPGAAGPADSDFPESPADRREAAAAPQPAAPVLTPDLLGEYQRCERGVPPDFAAMFGYSPPCVTTVHGRRAIDPAGTCAAPLIGDTGRSFDFTVPCQIHDFGYDLQRYYSRKATPHTGVTRRAADRQFREDALAHCGQTRSGFNEWTCENWASIYITVVEWSSRRREFKLP